MPAGRCDAADGNGESVLVYRRDTVVRLDLTDKARGERNCGRLLAQAFAAVLEQRGPPAVPAVEAAAWPARWQRLGLLAGWGMAERSVRGPFRSITTGFILRCREAPRSPRGLL